MSLVARGGLSPEVKLGAIGLHLTPEGESTHAEQGDQEQFLHYPNPFKKTDAGNARP
jgi:hypothetical protein